LTALEAPALIPALAVDEDSRRWLADLRSAGHRRDEAERRLHALLRKAADFEVRRRTDRDVDDLVTQAADDALLAVLAKLDDFRGESRFTTWAYKFALLEAGVRLRRRAWQEREVVLEPEGWTAFVDGGTSLQDEIEQSESLAELKAAIDSSLTPHQRQVFIALALNEVPIDVLADRLDTTRGALYKTLHDARKKLRAELE
jgi:RNA polymerase sigma-70 factor (ECF subfamily)